MTKAERTRLTAWRRRLLQEAGASARNVARTCRRFGTASAICRMSVETGTKNTATRASANRPRKPHRSPQSTPREVVSKILYLRQNYHFGQSKIAD